MSMQAVCVFTQGTRVVQLTNVTGLEFFDIEKNTPEN